jgi:hypothetical protein
MKLLEGSTSFMPSQEAFSVGASIPAWITPWGPSPSSDEPVIFNDGLDWFWEHRAATPAGLIAHNFTWKVNAFATPEAVRNMGNRALCHMAITYAPDEVVNALLLEVSRLWLASQSYALIDDANRADDFLMNSASSRILKSIVSARGSRPSPFAWTEDETQEP